MAYDPAADGALCNLCALRKMRVGNPVPSEFHNGAIGTVVPEAPGESEVKFGRPLCGASGMEYNKALEVLGRPRSTFHIVNSIACRPPTYGGQNNNLTYVMTRLKELNDRREAEGLSRLPSPAVCCEPRLRHDLNVANKKSPGSGDKLIAMGKIAVEALTGRRSPITDIQGTPITNAPEGEVAHKRWVLPVTHAAFVLRARRWTKFFRAAISRAIRWFETGEFGWVPARVLQRPTPEQLERWLFHMPLGWNGAYGENGPILNAIENDTETTIEGGPMWNRLRCVGLGKLRPDGNVAVLLIPILSVDGFTRFYSAEDEEKIKVIFRRLCSDESIEKHGHNSGYFDALIYEEWLAERPDRRADGAHLYPFRNFANWHDKIIMHRAVESELPHKLAIVGPAYTDVPDAWKEAHTATEARSDQELWKYNADRDVPIQARTLPPLREAVSMRDQWDVVHKDYRLQTVARGLHRNGIPVYEPMRLEWENKLRTEAGERNDATGETSGLLKEICDLSGRDDFNPRSVAQLRKLLYRQWNLAPACDPTGKPILTKGGYPSTSNAAILELRRRGDANKKEIQFIDKLRRYRKKSKLLATYILPLRPQSRPEDLAQYAALDSDGDIDLEAEAGGLTVDDTGRVVMTTVDIPAGFSVADLYEQYEMREGGVIAGRCHPNINVHTPKTGRLSTNRPASQTFPRELRNIFRARPGWKFTIADKDQIELRHACARAGAVRYLQVFTEKKVKTQLPDGTWHVSGDPHSLAAAMCFDKRFTLLEPDSPDREKIRDFVKRFVYSCLYLAEPPTVHRIVTSVEDMNGALLYPKMSLLEVTELRSNWLRENPEIVAWWAAEIDEYRKFGYRREAVWGRRCDFLDGEDENEITNFDEQAGCAAILHDDTFQVLDAIPFEKWGPCSGLVHSEHDKIVIEHPESESDFVYNVVNECMNRHVPQIPNVKFSAKPKTCNDLKG